MVFDTRNHREFPSPYAAPGLLTAETQLPPGPPPASIDFLLLVSAPPVLGPSLVDHIGVPLLVGGIDAYSVIKFKLEEHDARRPCDGRAMDPFDGQTFVDLESWFANDVAFERLLARLADYPHVVVFSGDVHFSCTLALDYWRQCKLPPITTKPISRIVQVTSSGARNHQFDIAQSLLRSYLLTQALLAMGAPATRLGWTTNTPTPISGAEAAPRPLRARLRGEPVFVPAEGWPAGASLLRPPDFAWRLNVIGDMRAEADRPEQARAPPSVAFDPGQPLKGYAAAVFRHSDSVPAAVPMRRIVFQHNVGLVRFRRGVNGLTLINEILSRNELHVPPPEQAEVNTVHEVPLSPPPDPCPILQTSGP